MPRRIVFGTELRKLCSETMHILHRAVAASLGPSGKLALLSREKQSGIITKDGVTICRNCLPLPDDANNLIGTKILEIANKTNEESGDGTTTSIVLANALFKEAIKLIEKRNLDPVTVRDEIEATLPKIMEQLDKRSKSISEYDDMENVATISANNDRSIGEMIAKGIDAVGQDGFVTLVEGESESAELTITEGIRIPKGPSTERFLRGKVTEEFSDVNILIVDGKIELAEMINDLYMQVAGQPLLVIGDMAKPPLEYMIENSRMERIDCLHVIPPMKKGNKVKLLNDVAVAVGATVIDPVNFDFGQPLDKKVLGKARIVTFNKHYTTIVEGGGEKMAILQRIEELKEEMETSRSDYERSMIRERISSLAGSTAVIGVGGRTNDEVIERHARFEDSLNATRSALLEGVIQGGGFTLFQIAQKLKGKTLGEKIFKVALESPLRQIIANTGMDVDEVVAKIRRSNKGYDARSHKLVNLYDRGVIDPVKSTKSGLKNAVSIVDLLINLEVLSVNVLDKDNAKEMLDAMKGVNADDM